MLVSRSILRQTMAILPVTFGNFMTGTVFGWLAPIFNTYKNSNGEFPLTDDDCSWMTMLQYVGRIVGCLLTAAFVDKLGRNILISSSAVIMTFSWIGTAFTQNIRLHYVIRLISGMSLGITNMTTPIYVGENSSPHIRAAFGSVSISFYFGGQIVGSILATYFSYHLSSQILVGISFVNLVSVFLLRETAQFLIMKNRETAAEKRFFWLRDAADDANGEFQAMKNKLTDKNTSFTFKIVRDKRFLIVCAVNSLAYLTGFPVMNTMISIALASTEQFSSNELTILFDTAQFIGSTTSPLFIDQYGRRTLWKIAASLSTAAHLFTAALYYAKEMNFDVPAYEWLLFACLTIYSTIFSSFIYPLSTITRGELLPQEYKAVGSCTSLILNSMWVSLIGFLFLRTAALMGMKMNFIIFAAFSFTLLLFSHFVVPETKGMTLVDIEKLYDKTKKDEAKT